MSVSFTDVVFDEVLTAFTFLLSFLCQFVQWISNCVARLKGIDSREPTDPVKSCLTLFVMIEHAGKLSRIQITK